MKYEINKNTLAILPVTEDKCRVIENENEYYISESSFEVVEHSCEYFGSSYTGRIMGTRSLTGKKYKTPVLVEETSSLIFLPTHSPRKKECSWISLNNIKSYYPSDIKNSTIIEFKTNDKLEVNVSYNVINNQILNATRLKLLISERIKDNIK